VPGIDTAFPPKALPTPLTTRPRPERPCPTCRGSTKRDELLARTGTFQVPYLEDPNTGVKMFESAAMVEYLEGTYALASK